MTDLTSLSLAEARDGLGAKRFSAVELTRASIEAVEAARALNCFIVETPDHALAQAAASDARIAKGEAGVLEGIPLGNQGSVLHEGRPDDGGQPHPRRLRAALRVDRVRQPVA